MHYSEDVRVMQIVPHPLRPPPSARADYTDKLPERRSEGDVNNQRKVKGREETSSSSPNESNAKFEIACFISQIPNWCDIWS